jgi:hypothetical protein
VSDKRECEQATKSDLQEREDLVSDSHSRVQVLAKGDGPVWAAESLRVVITQFKFKSLRREMD